MMHISESQELQSVPWIPVPAQAAHTLPWSLSQGPTLVQVLAPLKEADA